MLKRDKKFGPLTNCPEFAWDGLSMDATLSLEEPPLVHIIPVLVHDLILWRSEIVEVHEERHIASL